jgi:predicted metal-dependent peptidase
MAKADKGTSTTLPVSQRVLDPIRARDFDIDAHLVSLMWSESFFADIIRSLTKEETKAIPTAGVLQQGSDLKFWWNRDFVAACTDKEVKGLLKHEAYHLVLLHTTARRYDPHWVWNIACDLAINSMIPEDELPVGGLIPGKPLAPLSPDEIAKCSPEEMLRRQKLSDLIESFPKDESSEWYFGKLMDDPTVKEMEQERKENEKAFKEMVDKILNGGDGDDHDGWGDGGEGVSDEDRQLVEGKLRQAISEATKKADRNNSWGTVPAAMRDHIRKMVSGEIPWQSILRQFVGQTIHADRRETVTRLSRKLPYSLPGTTYNYRPKIGVYIDQSGSVSDEWLSMLFGELQSLASKCDFFVYHFDTEVDEDSRTHWKRGTRIDPHRTRCGGTDFEAPTQHALKGKGKDLDAYIIMTDGCAPKPSPSQKRRAWVVVPSQKLIFEKDHHDVLIQMTGKAAKAQAA